MEELEHIKREMDERGSSMTDGSRYKFRHHFDIIYVYNLNVISL